MPTVTIIKRVIDMFGDRCIPCEDYNYASYSGVNKVPSGSSFYIDIRPYREAFMEGGYNLPNGFRAREIRVTNLTTGFTELYNEMMYGGGGGGGSNGGGIGGFQLSDIFDDLDIIIDFDEGPTTSYSISTSVNEGGEILITPDPDETYNDYLQGQKISIFAIPEEGYELEDLIINGENYGSTNVVEYEGLSDNLDVEANFKSVHCTENIIQIKRGNTNGISEIELYDGELAFNNQTKEFRIGDDPTGPKYFNNCWLINGGSSGSSGISGGGGGTINPLTPVTVNNLVSWNDINGYYLKDATTSTISGSLFIKQPHSTERGEYRLKVYGDYATETYAGILDIGQYQTNSNYTPTNSFGPAIGFVANLIKSQNTSMFGGGLLISGVGSQGDYTSSPDPRIALALRNRNSTDIIEALQIYWDYVVRCPHGLIPGWINLPAGQTYNINGLPHDHDSRYLKIVGGLMQGSIDMDNNRITGLPFPQVGSDAISLDFLASVLSGPAEWQESIISIESSPPISPSSGDRHIVGDSATGDFEGHENDITTYSEEWTFETPSVNWVVGCTSNGFTYIFNGSTWADIPGAVSHHSLQDLLAYDDHAQYVHISNQRTINASHVFASIDVPFYVTSTGCVTNLNADLLDGHEASEFSLNGHSHDWVVLAGFEVTDPQEGDMLIWDGSEEAFINTPGNSGGCEFNTDHVFNTEAERDSYFLEYSEELIHNTVVIVDDTLYTASMQQYSSTTEEWRNVTLLFKGLDGQDGRDGIDGIDGEEGPEGPQGEQGIQGQDGPEGPPGNPGTSITMKGSVATVDDLPTSGNIENDGYYCESNDDCYVWSGTEWINVGSIVGPRGLQGVEGPQGPQGPQGIRGLTGVRGDIGASGPMGPMGPRGPAGISDTWRDPIETILNAPPEVYDAGDIFIVSDSPTTGSPFEGHSNCFASFATDANWYFEYPIPGTVSYNLETSDYLKFDGLSWTYWNLGSLLGLSDVPSSGIGQDGKVLVYNESESIFEWGEGGGGNSDVIDFTDLNDVPSSYSGQQGKFIAVNSAGDGLIFATTGVIVYTSGNSTQLLPETPDAGTVFEMIGTGTNWEITATNNKVIRMGATVSIPNGKIQSSYSYDQVKLMFTGTIWLVIHVLGSLIIETE